MIVEEGPLKEFSHSLEPHLRQLGLPTSLQKGIELLHVYYGPSNKSIPKHCKYGMKEK